VPRIAASVRDATGADVVVEGGSGNWTTAKGSPPRGIIGEMKRETRIGGTLTWVLSPSLERPCVALGREEP